MEIARALSLSIVSGLNMQKDIWPWGVSSSLRLILDWTILFSWLVTYGLSIWNIFVMRKASDSILETNHCQCYTWLISFLVKIQLDRIEMVYCHELSKRPNFKDTLSSSLCLVDLAPCIVRPNATQIDFINKWAVFIEQQ